MPLNFIPNQPILFEDPLFAGQTCLNNDVRAYAQLAQPGDTTCIQWDNPPVGMPIGCSMGEEPNVITNGQFDSLLTGWQQMNLSTGALSSPVNWSYTGQGAICGAGLFPLHTTTGIAVGHLVMVSFYVTDPTVQTSFLIGDAATNTWNTLTSVAFNYDGRATVVLYATTGSEIVFFANGIQEFRDVKVRDINFSYCFTPNNESFSWSYVESLNGFEYVNGHTPPTPLTLTGNVSNGSTYRITFKIKKLPVNPLNYIYIADATTNNIIVTADDNKEYSFFYTHTAATTQVTLNVSDWTNMIGTIIYDVKVELFSYDYTTRIVYTDNNYASISYDSSSIDYPIKFFEDKVIWCFDWSDIEDYEIPGAPLNSGCYKIQIVDNLYETSHTSYTVVNYLPTHNCSVMMVGDNNGIAFDFFFNDPSTDVAFTLRQRLRLLQFNPTYPVKSEEYLYSSGNHVRTYAETAKFRTAWFDYVDEPTHDVIRLQLLSDTLTIDAVEFFCAAEDYEPEWSANGKYNLAQSRVVLKAVAEKSLFNKSCQ